MEYLLDTNICIHFLHGKYDIDEKIKSIGESHLHISILTVLELKIGAEIAKSHGQQNNENLEGFIDNFDVLPIDNAIDLAAAEYARLEKAGTPLRDVSDLLIGCSAITNEMTLVTENTKHLGLLQGLKLENWIKR